MTLLGLTFTSPLVLLGLLTLPIIWWLLRLTPPRPKQEVFPPTRILEEIAPKDETPSKSPWWLTLLRLLMAAAVIFALANPFGSISRNDLTNDGPLLVIVDNGWSTGDDWELRRTSALALIEEAKSNSIPVALALTSQQSRLNLTLQTPLEAYEQVAAATPHPLRIDLSELANELANSSTKFETITWFSSGLEQKGSAELRSTIKSTNASVLLYQGNSETTLSVWNVENRPDAMVAEIECASVNCRVENTISAYDIKGRSLATIPFSFSPDEKNTQARFKLPIELRNEIVRISVDGLKSAGSVQLIDERFKRRRVGIITGGNADQVQPLLSSNYYITRALSPFSDVREPDEKNLQLAVKQLIEERSNTLVLADIGNIPEPTTEIINEWIDKGGMLIRFAGPRLAASENNNLIPVPLRQGDRSLGGTLKWGTPQPLASFEVNSPFSGITVPGDVTINRQVLAEPGIELEESTWASLVDGTPLVTARQIGKGWIVLFHVTADATWSNLPLSGAFVDMLRRVVAVSSGTFSAGNSADENNNSGNAVNLLPPLRNVDGFGTLGGVAAQAKQLAITAGQSGTVSLDNPPGFYGTSDAFVALNMFANKPDLQILNKSDLPANTQLRSYSSEKSKPWKPWFLLLAVVLFFVDLLVVLGMAGTFRHAVRFLRPASVQVAVLVCSLLIFGPETANAQSDGDEKNISPVELESVLTTRLAYVETGIFELDSISKKGLTGLTDFIKSRTALEPGAPIGLDISTDELSFYPLLYWPIAASSPVPDTASMGRIDAFMKNGGTVLFDTRDQLTGGFGGSQVSAATLKLRQILSSLDIPTLEPVPQNHVLTRAFYILEVFPGRYLNGPLWVEATQSEDDPNRPAQRGDGVSSILITSNDFAGAWAVENSGTPTLPIVPPNANQRVYAFRTGVNIMMYMLTGNYKSDQVHIPALLERLGQ